MAGGLLQLKAYGAQDFNLTGNPQISFFKTVYRRYTNFAMEYYSIVPEVNLPLSENDITTFNFDIKRNGDLVNNMYFCFKIPNIYSDENRDFRWIKNLGTSLINKVSVFIGSSLIDQSYGEWMNIWNELTLEENKKERYYEMIGNVPEVYQPELSNANYYPSKNKNSDNIPSIKERTIRVPLIFWFNINSALALPLISLQYSVVRITVEVRKITDLYTIVDSDITSESYTKRIKPNSKYRLNNFIKNINGEINSSDFFIEPFLSVNYIYLSKEEMTQFAKGEHRYLISQVRLNSFDNLIGSKTLDLSLQHPTSCLVIVAKRSLPSSLNSKATCGT